MAHHYSGHRRNGAPRGARLHRRLALTLLAVVAASLGGCEGVLQPRGPVGESEKAILLTSLFIMLAIVVPTILATLGFAWWFRASNRRAQHLPTFAYSGRIELVTWSIPILTVMFLAGIAWVGSHELDPAKPLGSTQKPLEVQVVSLDWKWLFILPEQHVAAVNALAVPVGRPLSFRLTSGSVMNAFFIPQLGSMIYTMNGMATRLQLQADHEGEYSGLSSHFSGDGFAGMHFRLRALAPAAFDAWVADAARSAGSLDRATYEALAKPSANVPPMTYRAPDDDLFAAIVSQKIAPAPGPAGPRTAANISQRVAEAICTADAPAGRRQGAGTLPSRSGI